MDMNIRSVDTLGILGGKVVLATVGGGYLRRYCGEIGVARIPLQNCGGKNGFKIRVSYPFPRLITPSKYLFTVNSKNNRPTSVKIFLLFSLLTLSRFWPVLANSERFLLTWHDFKWLANLCSNSSKKTLMYNNVKKVIVNFYRYLQKYFTRLF